MKGHGGSLSLLQITDLHLQPDHGARLLGVDTAASLDAVLRAALSQRRADALIVTGDIAHSASEATYARARAAIAAHFHGPAAAGKNAGIALGLPNGNLPAAFEGSATLSDVQAADLLAGRWYFNLHTAAYPAGEIRGQVVK